MSKLRSAFFFIVNGQINMMPISKNNSDTSIFIYWLLRSMSIYSLTDPIMIGLNSFSFLSRVTTIPHSGPLVFPTPGPGVFPR